MPRWTRSLLCAAFVILGLVATGAMAEQPTLGAVDTVFVGTVRTMDALDTVAEAMAVDARGLIVAVGPEDDVLGIARANGTSPEVVRLPSGQAILPGFIDPHMHVIGLLPSFTGLVSLFDACRPAPYSAADPPTCSNSIQTSFTQVRDNLDPERQDVFVLGFNLDPSRQNYSDTIPSAVFKAHPAKFIEVDLAKDRPVLIVDQSGHFGYVNALAFDRLMAILDPSCTKTSETCDAWPPTLGEGAIWNTKDNCTPQGAGDNSCYTGLLTEIPGYNPFFQAVGPSVIHDYNRDPAHYIEGLGVGVEGLLESLRGAGLTTITSMAQSDKELEATERLAELAQSGTRMVSVVPPDIARNSDRINSKPILPACDPLTDDTCRLPKNLGLSGIKMIADGSTQGCTAALAPPLTYLTTSECKNPEGHIDFDPSYMHDQLKDLWQSGVWRFETHANGNAALDMVLDVYAWLQQEKINPHTATVIHATVGEESLWKRAGTLRRGRLVRDGNIVPAVDLRFTHLIGHVAYWGDVFVRQLGAEAAANIDPTAFDLRHGIPFTFHSDAPVSIPRPLWFVRQAVMRETWQYPELTEKSVLGPQHRVSVTEALRAVTIRVAEEKELEQWVGSLEVGKVADFVVLSADPVQFDPIHGGNPAKISEIAVIDTYLGGEVTGSQP